MAQKKAPRLLIAPLEGLMDGLFFQAMAELGWAEYFVTPFFRVGNALPGSRAINKFLVPVQNSGLKFTVQLLGTDAALMAQTARLFCEHGASGIDLNFACPVKKVFSNGGGGALLHDPQKMQQIITAVAGKIPKGCTLSIKLRSGVKAPGEMAAFLPLLRGLPVDFAVMHYRTVSEMYHSATGRESRLAQAAELLREMPLLASGDIFSPQDARDILQHSSCHGIALARGILRDPLLFKRLKNPQKTYPNDHYARICLFNQLVGLAKVSKQYNRSNFVALGRFMFGLSSVEFETIKNAFINNLEFKKLEL